MVIVGLQGGIGNQMFQYALGRALAYQLDVPLKFDLSNYSEHQLRKFELGNFNIAGSIASETDLALAKGYGVPGRILAPLFGSIFKKLRFRTVHEKSLRFCPDIFAIRGNIYLVGYWQSEKYFAQISSIVRNEFTVRCAIDEVNGQRAEQIGGVTAVSMHVRRGDYVSDAHATQTLGVLPLDYYQSAVKLVASRVDTPHFFVFTDDTVWAKEHIRIAYPLTFVTHNRSEKSFMDIYLMSRCQHNIVANSTFSWWGAWLNPNLRKIVVAPAAWYRDPAYDPSDLIPSSWERC